MSDQEKVKQAQAIARLRENMAATLEYTAYMAELTRAKYLALVKAGFTEEQALSLCKQP